MQKCNSVEKPTSKNPICLSFFSIVLQWIAVNVEPGGAAAPQIFATLHSSWIKENSVKVKNSIKLKTSWNFSKVTDISNITIDLDTPEMVSCQ